MRPSLSETATAEVLRLGQDGVMIPTIGYAPPRAHDELTEWTTAELAEADGRLPLPLASPPWPGEVLTTPTGDSLFVRRTAGSGDTDAWYLHGLAGSSTNWTPLAGLLADRATGFAVDLPGSGRSDPPAGGDYGVRNYVRTLADLISAHATGPIHLVGNSFGGFLATVLAARYPHLVRTLTLVSPAVPDLRLRGERGADPRLALLLAPGTTRIAEPRLSAIPAKDRAAGMLQFCFGDPDLVSEEDLDAAAGDLAWRRDLPWAQLALLGQLRGLMKAYLHTGRGSWWSAAAKVTVPTLVIWGTRDRLVDVRLARRTAQAFVDSRLLVLAGVGHVAQMEDPVSTARAIRMLWQSSSGAPRPH